MKKGMVRFNQLRGRNEICVKDCSKFSFGVFQSEGEVPGFDIHSDPPYGDI